MGIDARIEDRLGDAAMSVRTVVHQFNPDDPVTAGIDTVLRDLVKFSAGEDRWCIVGVQRPERGRRGLGRWREAEVGGRAVAFLPVAALDPSDQRRTVPHSWRLASGLVRFGRNRLPGALHSHRPDVGAAVAALYPSAPRVVWSHTSTTSALGADSDSIWRHLRFAYTGVERLAVRGALAVVAAGEPERRRLEAITSAPCHALPSWYDDTLFRPRTRQRRAGPLRVAWAGRLEAPKDPLLAVAVAAALRNAIGEFVLDVYGSGTLDGAVRAAVRAADLDEHVIVHGPLPRERLAERLADADVLLMTSHFEGAPRILVEAMGCGTPVAGPSAVDPDGVLTPLTGRLVPDRDPIVLAEAVLGAAALDRVAVHREASSRGASVLVPQLLHALAAERPAETTRRWW